MTSTALITTTINVPELLLDYARDAKAHGHAPKFVVAGDRKTPPEAAAFCAKVEQETGVECEYMGVEDQNAFLSGWGQLNEHLGWNCVQRRNVAVLKAYVDGADTVVTIDDDNLVEEEDYFGGHRIVGQETQLDVFGTPGEWFNVCGFLDTANGFQFVARGYGMAARACLPDRAAAGAPPEKRSAPVAVNAGFWLGDPDIDAVTRLAISPDVTGYSRAENFFVAPGAFTPFNSQNTALARTAVPAYFLSPLVGRFDDIFISNVVKRIADHLGHGVAFGRPLVRQVRNEHDLYRDLDLELLGMRTIDRFVVGLADVALSEGGYAGCLLEICDQLPERLAALAPADLECVQGLLDGCRLWAQLPVWD